MTADRSPAAATPLRDPRGRGVDTLRLGVTDRCNLRCRYCMPARGAGAVSRSELLSFADMRRLAGIATSLGVRRIRVTGGEPLARDGVVELLADIADLPAAPEVLLTSNGLLLGDRLDDLHLAGVRRVNLSLDSLDRTTYERITRSDALETVLPLLDAVPAAGLGLKINTVILPGLNDHEIPDFARLARDRGIEVRFIEPMPFLGGSGEVFAPFSGDAVVARLAEAFGEAPRHVGLHGTADLYDLPGGGRVGVIRGHTRSFCALCTRLRIDARGGLRTCLYGGAVADLRAMLRDGADDAAIVATIRQAVANRPVDGFAARAARDAVDLESMVGIGG